MRVTHTLPLLALTYASERETRATSALIRLESETMGLEEPSSNARWVEVFCTQICILPSLRRILLYLLDELLDPWRSSTFRLHRMAAQARPVSCNECIANTRVELDV